jgi:sugar/nucleoside kinase (ribokinase family)
LNEYEACERILTKRKAKSVIITRGKLGASVYEAKEKNGHRELDKTDIPPLETAKFKDSTGCGDVFASAFFYRRVSGAGTSASDCAHYASRVAARKAELAGPEEMDRLIE